MRIILAALATTIAYLALTAIFKPPAIYFSPPVHATTIVGPPMSPSPNASDPHDR